MKNKTILISFLIVGLSAIAATSFGAFSSSGLKNAFAVIEPRELYFRGKTSITTANGNVFETFWINKTSGSDMKINNSYVYLEGTANINLSTDQYVINSPVCGIKGNYDISNVTKVTVEYKLSSQRSLLYFNTLNESKTGVYNRWLITETTFNGQTSIATYTKTFEGENSYHGFGFTLTHHDKNGGVSDTMKAYIYSVKIEYNC